MSSELVQIVAIVLSSVSALASAVTLLVTMFRIGALTGRVTRGLEALEKGLESNASAVVKCSEALGGLGERVARLEEHKPLGFKRR